MPFAPPTHGYEESDIGETLSEYLVPNITTHSTVAPNSLVKAGIEKGDLIMVDRSKSIRHGSTALILIDGDSYVVELCNFKGKWYAISDERKGTLSDSARVLGIVTNVIKDQLK